MVYDTERKYYVYAWYIKDTKEIFYIGKGTNYRYKTRKRENKAFMDTLERYECESIILKDNLNEKEAFKLEIALIKYFRIHSDKLVNVADGGENPPKVTGARSSEWKENISRGLRKAHKEHPEYAKAISERMKVFLKTEEGKTFQQKSIKSRDNEKFRKEQSVKCRAANRTSEYKERHSKLMSEIYKSEELRNRERGKNNPRAQGVKQFDLNGNFIAEYETITKASQKTGVNLSRISDVARGNRKTAGGYLWKFTNDKHIHHKKKPIYNIENDKNLKPVLQYDLQGNLIGEYRGIAEATRINGFNNRTNIICNLKGRTKSAYGFVWKYK